MMECFGRLAPPFPRSSNAKESDRLGRYCAINSQRPAQPFITIDVNRFAGERLTPPTVKGLVSRHRVIVFAEMVGGPSLALIVG